MSTVSLNAGIVRSGGASFHDASIGDSSAMRDVLRLIERAAPTDAPVFLTGESGVGKAHLARLIHEKSRRHRAPFVTIACGAMAAGLIEEELFGGEVVLVNGNKVHQPGAFERASGGTLYFDEVSEMPAATQVRLSSVLKAGSLPAVGNHPRSADVRIVSSTTRCAVKAAQGGQLREDLLYRLAVFPIDVPPLRDRGPDIELLAEHFVAQLNDQNHGGKRLTAAARVTLRNHAWPGNVRELKNCIERAYILYDNQLELAPLSEISEGAHRESSTENHDSLHIRVGSRIHDMERSLIVATLTYFKGNKRRAADALGCSLKTLYNKLNGYSQNQECASG